MTKKMTLEEASEIIQLQNEMNKFFEKQDALYKKLIKKYGDSVHYLEHRDQEYPWIKVTLTDNVAKAQAGEDIWKATKFSPVSVETRPLKKKPKI